MRRNGDIMKALIAMSGGVDSSVAAFLTKQAGFDCCGCTMKLHDFGLSEKACGSPGDAADAKNTAEALGMPFEVLDFSADFRKEVIDRFVGSYLRGETPNPCIDCNRFMKFGRLHEKAAAEGIEYVVTGHYARIEEMEGRFYLKKALDETKDQSYVLYSLTQSQLAHTMFPLGEYTKTRVREIASEQGFSSAVKPDSQDICFVPDGDYAKIIEATGNNIPPQGNFVSTDGKILGRHRGIIHYTVGQRRGLGIAAEYPYYVLGIDTKSNSVILGQNSELFRTDVTVKELNWISGKAPRDSFRCLAKIRYRHKESPATAFPLDDGRIKIVFDEPQRAATPGQSAVLYDGDTVLGGGIITAE